MENRLSTIAVLLHDACTVVHEKFIILVERHDILSAAVNVLSQLEIPALLFKV